MLIIIECYFLPLEKWTTERFLTVLAFVENLHNNTSFKVRMECLLPEGSIGNRKHFSWGKSERTIIIVKAGEFVPLDSWRTLFSSLTFLRLSCQWTYIAHRLERQMHAPSNVIQAVPMWTYEINHIYRHWTDFEWVELFLPFRHVCLHSSGGRTSPICRY